MDRYLQRTSNHHTRQKSGIIKTLVDRAKRICDPKNLTEGLQHLNKALQSYGYLKRERKKTNIKSEQVNKQG